MAHRRSPKGFVRQFVLKKAYRDSKRAETVCQTTIENLRGLLNAKFGFVEEQHIAYLRSIELTCGEVLVDSRGNGSFQRGD